MTQKNIIFLRGSFFLIVFIVMVSIFVKGEIIALCGGKFITLAGKDIEKGTLLIKDGRILDLGEKVSFPSEVKIIDVKGLIILPGPIDSFTHLGVSDILPENQDFDEKTNPITPHLHIIDSLNPNSKNISLVRKFGITTALIAPGETNVLSGQSALINLLGTSIEEMIIKFPLGVHANLGELPKGFYGSKGKMPSTRMGEVALLREIFIQTKEYLFYQNQINTSEDKQFGFKNTFIQEKKVILQSLIPVVEKKLPLIIRANRTSDILAALRIAKEFDLKIILNHGAESYKVARLLKKRRVPVLLGPTSSYFAQVETERSNYKNALLLWKEGVKFSFQSLSGQRVDNLFYQASQAIRNGLPCREALKALTLYPAQIFGVADKLGSIEKGKLANLVVFEGNPLIEINSKLKMVIIKGQIIQNNY
jgi:imidazolonepropionase-like amidohydrolase